MKMETILSLRGLEVRKIEEEEEEEGDKREGGSGNGWKNKSDDEEDVKVKFLVRNGRSRRTKTTRR